ncbi:MAG: hypothetical protein IT363_16180 [Methanoregulaceae archaeon]|nr:hypothetical protein [Methanoregulaceae archaeon]
MSTPRKPRALATAVLIVGVLGLCLAPCLISIACRPDPKAIVTRIPVGSRLSELDAYLTQFYESSDVLKWTPNPKARRGTGSYRDKYGGFDTLNLGPYDRWTATKSERDRFTGELRFYHHSAVVPDDLAPSFWVYLVYIDGVLKEADYGILPG